jgi:DNA-binding response OmpR family regulator
MARLLIVEDDPDVLLTLRTVLEEAEHVVASATTNQQAQEIIRQGGLDLIISDAGVPGSGGGSIVDAANRLGIPLLLISGDAEKIDRLRHGTSAFLVKPFRGRALVAMVDRLLGKDHERS